MTGHAIRPSYRTGADVLRELYDRNHVLCTVAIGNLVLAIVFGVLMQVDSRMILGRNAWLKPWKFAISIGIFTATMGWLLPSLSLTDRVGRTATYVIGTAMVIEILLISTQAARGVPSHFNDSTPLDTALFAVMGATITISTLVVAYVLWRSVRNPPPLDPTYRLAIWLGILLFVVASFEGWLMVGLGTHSVGGSTDGAHLPLLHWSLTGGDLRISHSIGLHALQVLPLTGYVVARWDGVSTRRGLGIVGIVGTGYAGVVGATFVWALFGNPLVPSLPTPSWPTVFRASFLLVAPFWVSMVLAPTWDLTERIITLPSIALPVAVLYLVVLLPQAGSVAAGVTSPSLSGVAALLATDAGATLAWVHFLAFDLFVGRWIYRDARRRDITPLLVSPILVATLLFGPVGYLGYCTLRTASTTDASHATDHQDTTGQ